MSIELNAKALLLADQCQGIGESDGWPQLLEAAAAIRRLVAELQARAQVQGAPSWWMRETDEGAAEWTDTAPLVLSGWTPLYTQPQPAQGTQADVTDAGIEQVLALAHSYADAKLMRYGALGIKEPPDPAAAFSELRRAILALRTERVPMTGEQWTDVLGSAGPDLLDLAKQWSDNKVHVYQVVNEAEKIVKAAVLRGITAQTKKETP